MHFIIITPFPILSWVVHPHLRKQLDYSVFRLTWFMSFSHSQYVLHVIQLEDEPTPSLHKSLTWWVSLSPFPMPRHIVDVVNESPTLSTQIIDFVDLPTPPNSIDVVMNLSPSPLPTHIMTRWTSLSSFPLPTQIMTKWMSLSASPLSPLPSPLPKLHYDRVDEPPPPPSLPPNTHHWLIRWACVSLSYQHTPLTYIKWAFPHYTSLLM